MADSVKTFGTGIFFHDVTVLAEVKNCLFNTDVQVLLELYILCKKDGAVAKRFPRIIPFVEVVNNDRDQLCAVVQNKVNMNPILDFYDWDGSIPGDPFRYADELYRKLYYEYLDDLKVDPIPTLLANLIKISIKLDDFHKLYILGEYIPEHMKNFIASFFNGSNKVELLEGSLKEAVAEIPDINFFILEDVENMVHLATRHKRLTEVLIPGFRSNLLNADNLEEEPPVLAIPEGCENYYEDFNLTVKSIGIPI